MSGNKWDSRITELQKQNEILQAKIDFLTEHDALTGLYNRKAFLDRADRLLNRFQEQGFVFIQADIEQFKLFNELFGFGKGDLLLCRIADELRKRMGDPQVLLARTSGDIFGVCAPQEREKEIIAHLLEIFHEASKDTMLLQPAIGICRFQKNCSNAQYCFDRATMARNTVKGNLIEHVAVFDDAQRSQLLMEQELFDHMEEGIKARNFQVYFQPKCNMHSGKVVGAEALVRWAHPTRGLLLPGKFIPLFEKNHFIRVLDQYMWREIARWQRAWLDSGHRTVPISVNVSRDTLQGVNVAEVMQELVQEYNLPKDLIELEVTESAYVCQDVVQDEVNCLLKAGFTVLMDDFGSGYSSLNLLSDICVNALKVDMRFLSRDTSKSHMILQTIIQMSRWARWPVIAEGVETEKQVAMLRRMGYIYAQGFFFYRPMPQKCFEQLLMSEKTDFEDGGKKCTQGSMILTFQDLLHEDLMTLQIAENILGTFALYIFDGQRLLLLNGNEKYYALMDSNYETSAGEDVLTDIKAEDCPMLLQALQTAENGEIGEETTAYLRRARNAEDDTEIWLFMRLFCLSKNGTMHVFYASVADVTERIEAVERLHVSEASFRIAMDATSMVVFELDVNTHEAKYSKYIQEKFGLNSAVMPAPEGFIREGMVCSAYEAVFRQTYEAIYQGEPQASCVFRAQLADGRQVWSRLVLNAIKNKAGKTLRAVGLVEQVNGNTT